MDKERTRLRLRRWVNSGLKATAEVIENINKHELADLILGEWLKGNVKIEVGGKIIRLGERPGIKIDGDDVRIVDVDLEKGGDSP